MEREGLIVDAAAETKRLEHWVHWTLLAGLLASATLLGLGLAAALFGHRAPRPEGPPPPVPTLARAALRADADALLDLGLLALIATPVLRVAVLAIGWAVAGERRFAAVALVVLAILLLSMALGFG